MARSPKLVGRCDDENGAGVAASFDCGTSIRVSISVEPITKQISQIRYQTNGCGVVVACAEEMFGRLQGIKLTELDGMAESAPILADGLMTPERKHCVEMVNEGFRAVLADHRRRTVDEFVGENALICSCFGVSEDTIIGVITIHGALTVDDVSALCNAGSGCGSCQMLIRELIDAAADGR